LARNKIVASIIALTFVVLGVGMLLWRIGDVIGWEDAAGGWGIIALLVLLIILVAFFIYRAISGRLVR